jgi:1-deoxy-D-xylulose-5-phosphate synthase
VTRLLDGIRDYRDLRKLSFDELAVLARELREEIDRVVQENGGHWGSNLGVVDLTIALHYVFDLDFDRVVFDVSHQIYTHKLLSGRRERFATLRRRGGLSGFACRTESPFDAFTSGHAGTAISTALGLLCGDEIAGVKRKVIAVVGDGAITCGQSFEALNHAGALKKDFLVILNDNAMSISPTVGALANHFNRIRLAPLYEEIRQDVRKVLDHIPVVGPSMEKALDRVRQTMETTMGGHAFSELGFHYYGPVDGHNIPGLIDTLRHLRKMKGPILLHVVTKKGPMYAAAPRPKPGAAPAPPRPTYTDVFAGAVAEAARRNPRVVGVTAAMTDGSGLYQLAKEFPARYFDTAICEQHAVGFSAGMAAAGLVPVCAIYSTFIQRGFDQVFQEMCLQRLPVVLALDRACLVGPDGPTHHGLFDIAFLRTLPEIVLLAPKDGPELVAMLHFAVELGRPVALRWPRAAAGELPGLTLPPAPVRLGQAEVLRQGPDGALLAYGATVETAWSAAQALDRDGIRLTVVNARFAKPLDDDLISGLTRECPFIMTLEEHALAGGFGAAVLESVARCGGRVDRVLCRGVPDRFIEHGTREELLAQCGLDVASVVEGVRDRLRSGLRPGVERSLRSTP